MSVNIGQAAKASGLSERMIRYFKKQGLIPAPARSGGGYRSYSDDDVRRMRTIALAQDVGFPTEVIRQLLSMMDGPGEGRGRAHQLPSALVCPDHGELLRESTLDREARRRGYVAASYANCPTDAACLVDVSDARVLADLVVLARQSDMLLNSWDEVHPDDWRDGYLESLERLGLINRLGEAKLPGLARAMDCYWGSTLDLWPRLRDEGRCGQGWLDALLMREHRSPPLHHLLLEGLLGSAVPA